MYFASRAEAGKQLAKELSKYRFEDTVAVALTEGGVVVGAQIAAELHCPLMFLLMRDITLPGEISALGVVDQNGGFTYNDMFSAGELEGMTSEFHGFIEQEKMQKFQEVNRLLGDGGLLDPEIIRDRVVILVADGLTSGTSLLAAMNFIKPIRTKRVVIASVFASVSAVDKMHILGDELHVLTVYDGTFELDHYFEKNDVPSRDDIIATLNNAILKWK
ncbi:MAG: putative phosphoribosyl transferase [Patescibacteria group bacterium]|nr:putative phosphoribosyl transferase [Patescibacteria group bacterium]